MKKFIVIIITLAMALSFGGCTNEVESDTNPEGQTLTFVGSKMVTVDYDDYIALIFDYTNESGKSASIADAFDVVAFQNGVEVNRVAFMDGLIDGAIDCSKKVQTGFTATVVWFFPEGDGSPISVEVSNGDRFVVKHITRWGFWESDALEVTFVPHRLFVVENEESPYHGKTIAAISIRIRNLSDVSHELNISDYVLYGSNAISSADAGKDFSNSIESVTELEAGATCIKYLYVLCEEDGIDKIVLVDEDSEIRTFITIEMD